MLDILPSGCKTQKFSEFYRHPGLTLSAVGICTYNPNDLYSEKISHWIKTATPVSKAAPTLAPAPVAEVKPANPVKDKVRAMREMLLSDEYAEQKRAVNRFMLVLTTLYSLDSKAFAEATESLHGRTRVYFAEDARTLLKSGNQTKPKQVPGTPWWVITNTNTGRKCSMIEHIMQSMQFPAELIEKVCGTI